MFTSRIALLLLFLVVPLTVANTPAVPDLSEQEMLAQLDEQMAQVIEAVRQVGGLYIVTIETLPSRSKIAVIKVLKEAAKSPQCDEMFEAQEQFTIIFKGPQGKVEAEKLIKSLEMLDCKIEYNEVVF